jgi:hypothetical protein
MGEILVERGFINADQLAAALVTQAETGRRLGEICVEKHGLDRLALADALSEQWEAMQSGRPTEQGGSSRAVASAVTQELRVLLDEAEAARAKLAAKTDELEQRLILLETIMTGVSEALFEPRAVNQ